MAAAAASNLGSTTAAAAAASSSELPPPPELDFFSLSFDAAQALAAPLARIQLPYPKIRPLNNLAECERRMFVTQAQRQADAARVASREQQRIGRGGAAGRGPYFAGLPSIHPLTACFWPVPFQPNLCTTANLLEKEEIEKKHQAHAQREGTVSSSAAGGGQDEASAASSRPRRRKLRSVLDRMARALFRGVVTANEATNAYWRLVLLYSPSPPFPPRPG